MREGGESSRPKREALRAQLTEQFPDKDKPKARVMHSYHSARHYWH